MQKKTSISIFSYENVGFNDIIVYMVACDNNSS